jgi:hypothetical protein
MQCFHHIDTPSVCACNTCFKGLCQTCAAQFSTETYSACSQNCKQSIEKIQKINQYAIQLYGITDTPTPQKAGLKLGLMDMVIGLVFLAFGAYFLASFEPDAFSVFFISCGIIFMLKGLNFIKKIK